jgi:hypothetical protein
MAHSSPFLHGYLRVSVRQETYSNDAGVSTLPSSIAFSAPASFPDLRDSARCPRQTVDLPSQDEIEDEACEIAEGADHGGGIDHLEDCRYETNRPERHAQPAKALAKGWGPEHGYPEGNETYRHDKEPDVEHRIEYAPGRLPQEGECRLILGGRPRSVIEVRERDLSDMHESSGREHAETQNAQDAPEESGCEARPPESAIQGEEDAVPEPDLPLGSVAGSVEGDCPLIPGPTHISSLEVQHVSRTVSPSPGPQC